MRKQRVSNKLLMSMKKEQRIIRNVIDKDGNLVVAILKYNSIMCLVHSGYGFLSLGLLLATVAVILLGAGFASILTGVLCLFFWLKAWLHANDKLKCGIYPDLLEQHLLKNGGITSPFIIKRYYPDPSFIKCITVEGDEQSYKVEFLQEKLPLYVVKICIVQS